MCVVSREQRYFCCVSLSFFYIHLFFIYSFINLGLTGPARLSALLHHHGDRICGHPKTTRLLGRPLPPCYPKNLSLMSVILHCMIVIHFLFVHSWPSVLWCSLSNLGFTLRRLLNCTSSLCTFSKPEIEVPITWEVHALFCTLILWLPGGKSLLLPSEPSRLPVECLDDDIKDSHPWPAFWFWWIL